MLHGNMLTGIYRDNLILILSERDYEDVIKVPFTHPFDITGKSMKGWALLDGQGLKPENYKYWIKKAKDKGQPVELSFLFI
jgi:hypothetical protein